MVFSHQFGTFTVLLSLLSISGLATAASIDITYCASLLTTSSSANSSNFQSDGLCYNFCSGSAFAIVQEKDCWCSDYAPDSGDRVDTSECNTECPGYPDDTCGGNGLYGYMQLGKAAVGTKGGVTTTAAAATTTTAEGTVLTETVQNTVTVNPTTSPTTKTSTTTTPSESPTSTDRGTGTSTADIVTTASPTTFLSTITAGGSVILQTVTILPTVASSETSASSSGASTGSKGLSTGAAVGTAVGVLGFAVIVIAVGLFLWFRRKKRNEEGTMLQHQDSLRGSSAGMMGTPRTEMASVWDGEAQSVGRRSSRLMPHDPRMDPFAPNIYGRFDNKSHESVNTLRDDQDYSRRVLRTTNPDQSAGE